VQLGPVRYGASREVALQLKLPPQLLMPGRISNVDLRKPLLEVSLLTQPVDGACPLFLQRSEFRAMQVPSLLMEQLLPFPVRLVLDNDLEDFDSQSFLQHAAETFGVQQHELELTRLLRGSVIVDMHLKVEPARAASILDEVPTPQFRQKMETAMSQAGYRLKSLAAPGQQVFRRLLQTRLGGGGRSWQEGRLRRDQSSEVVSSFRIGKVFGSWAVEYGQQGVTGL